MVAPGAAAGRDQGAAGRPGHGAEHGVRRAPAAAGAEGHGGRVRGDWGHLPLMVVHNCCRGCRYSGRVRGDWGHLPSMVVHNCCTGCRYSGRVRGAAGTGGPLPSDQRDDATLRTPPRMSSLWFRRWRWTGGRRRAIRLSSRSLASSPRAKAVSDSLADGSCLVRLKRSLMVQGGCHQMTVSPTARRRRERGRAALRPDDGNYKNQPQVSHTSTGKFTDKICFMLGHDGHDGAV